MVEPALYAAFGACLATLILLLFLPAFWNRAVRLTTRRLAGRLPLSIPEIVAAQDRLRAEHAMAMRSVERRAEAALADVARERVTLGAKRSDELALKAEVADLRDAILALEAQGALVRIDLDRTGAEAAAAAKALEAAQAETKAALRDRDAARKAASAAELAADGLRIDLAATEAALAALRLELAQASRPMAPRALPAEAKPEDTLATLRARLDQLADEIVGASMLTDGGRAKEAASLVPTQGQDRAGRLLPTHA